MGILRELGLDRKYLGFAMIAVSNALWRKSFEAVPYNRRIFLLPNCLRHSTSCKGHFDETGLQCAGCGGCVIENLKRAAEALGYEVLIAEGTPIVVMKILEGRADAILGVACIDSMDRVSEKFDALAVPHQGIPLLKDGCRDTSVEADLLLDMVKARGKTISRRRLSYAPLLQETAGAYSRLAAKVTVLLGEVRESLQDVRRGDRILRSYRREARPVR